MSSTNDFTNIMISSTFNHKRMRPTLSIEDEYQQNLKIMNDLDYEHPLNKKNIKRTLGIHKYNYVMNSFKNIEGPYVACVGTHYNSDINLVTTHFIHRNKNNIISKHIRYSKINENYEYGENVNNTECIDIK